MLTFTDEEKQSFKQASSGFEQLPLGEYSGILVDVNSGIYGKNKDKKLVLKIEVETPENFLGRIHQIFVSYINVQWILKKTLKQFGISSDIELDEIEGTIFMKKGSKVDFEIFENKGHINTNIKSVESDHKPDLNLSESIDMSDIKDEDIPF